MKYNTIFTITKKPGPMALIVETSPFSIKSRGDKWVAEREVTYTDDTVNVFIRFKGFVGQDYEMTLSINSVTKTIKGLLNKNGLNDILCDYKIEDFSSTPPNS
jgi:hypothetical protein